MKKSFRILCSTVSFVLIAAMLSSCSVGNIGKKAQDPQPVSVATDLDDPMFTFTYGELKSVFAPDNLDKLATLFEDYDQLSDDVTIQLNYNDLKTRYQEKNKDLFNAILGLLDDGEKAQLYGNTEEALDYFNKGLQRVKDERPITKVEEDFWVDDNSIEYPQLESGSQKRMIDATKLYKDFSVKGLKSGYFKNTVDKTTKKGDDLTDVLYLLGSDKASLLTTDNVVSLVSSVTPTYKTASDKKTKIPVEYVRTIEITLKDDDSSVLNAFSPNNKSDILNELNKSKDYFTIDDFGVKYDACTIVATFNAVTDNILTVKYYKNMKINTQVTGTGSLADLGQQELKFHCTDNRSYSFGWDDEAK